MLCETCNLNSKLEGGKKKPLLPSHRALSINYFFIKLNRRKENGLLKSIKVFLLFNRH